MKGSVGPKNPDRGSEPVKLGILTREEPIFSLLSYRENLLREFSALGVHSVSLDVENPDLDAADLVWDPALIGSRFPHPQLRNCNRPVVATVHGLAAHTLSIRESFLDPLEAMIGQAYHELVAVEWQWFGKQVARVIGVSRYSADEVVSVFQIPRRKVVPVYHGVDHDIFNVRGEKVSARRPYLLHIAQYAVKKNVDRLFAAYDQLPESHRPDLVAILPNYDRRDPDIEGLQVIRKGFSHQQLAPWYRGALAFVFPSLHETFGLPILEAMACGCPVLTSNLTAMPELTADAALLVNPRSVEELTHGLLRLVRDKSLRQDLRKKGLARARRFTWERSAREHLAVFDSVLEEKAPAHGHSLYSLKKPTNLLLSAVSR